MIYDRFVSFFESNKKPTDGERDKQMVTHTYKQKKSQHQRESSSFWRFRPHSHVWVSVCLCVLCLHNIFAFPHPLPSILSVFLSSLVNILLTYGGVSLSKLPCCQKGLRREAFYRHSCSCALLTQECLSNQSWSYFMWKMVWFLENWFSNVKIQSFLVFHVYFFVLCCQVYLFHNI